MCPTFTADDIGKSVETADGESLGVVAAVDPETAYVEPNASAADSGGEDAVPLADGSVERVTDESVRLEAGFPVESLAKGTESADEPSGRDAEYDPGESVSPARGEPDGVGTEPASDAEADALEHSEPMMEDEGFTETAAGDPRADASAEPEPPEADSSAETERTDAEALESVEEEASRELEVDPSELTDGDPEAELESGEDVGRRGSAADVGGEVDEPAGPSASDPEAVDTEYREGTSERADDVDEGGDVEDREPETDG